MKIKVGKYNIKTLNFFIHKGKNTIKGATQVNGNCIFVCLKDHKSKHNNLDCHFFLEYFALITNFTCSKLDTNQKCFCMFKTLKPQKWTVLGF